MKVTFTSILISNRASKQASSAHFHSMSWIIRHEEFKGINIIDCFPPSSKLQGPPTFTPKSIMHVTNPLNLHHPSLIGFNYSSITGGATVQHHFYHMRNRALLRIRCFLSYESTT